MRDFLPLVFERWPLISFTAHWCAVLDLDSLPSKMGGKKGCVLLANATLAFAGLDSPEETICFKIEKA